MSSRLEEAPRSAPFGRARRSSPVPLRVAPAGTLPDQVAVGRGTALFLDGRCAHPAGIRSLEIVVDGRAERAMAWDMPAQGGGEGGDYWWGIVDLPAVESPRFTNLSVRARLRDGSVAEAPLAPIQLVRDRPAPPQEEPTPEFPGPAGERVAVAMASYEPSIELFETQIRSIREQTHENWICLISDDASSDAALAAMREVIGDDPRFLIARNESNAGFYRNFERALSLVPDAADYVAMTDQDDCWRPDKLRSLLDGLEQGSRLVYSDMRIVEEDGEVISDTYWSMRRNNHTDFASLVLANTVTGAASLFERSLLDDALPFPPRVGNAYHDHWIAQVALATGGISYVDRPLYDYVQHGDAALGHLSANAFGRFNTPRRTRMKATLSRLRHSWRPGWRGLYFNLYCRVSLAARVLKIRCESDLDRGKRRSLDNISDSMRGVAWLALRSTRPWWGANETLGRERAMLGGLAWRRGVKLQQRLSRARNRALGRGPVQPLAISSGTPGGPEVHRDSAVARSGGSREHHSASGPGTGEGTGPGRDTPDEWLEPILLDYFTRDGSTVMMHLLGSSPGIAVENAYPFERKYFAYLWRWSQLLERGPNDEWGANQLGTLNQFTARPVMGPIPWHPRPLIETAATASPDLGDGIAGSGMGSAVFDLAWREFSRRAAARHRAERDAPGAEVRYFAEKHLNTWMVDLDRIPPVRLIALLRDPRDTWVSINSFNELRGNTALGRERAADEREHLMQVISRQRERLRWVAERLTAGDSLVVRYEDLVRDMPGVAERIGSELGVELDPGLVERERAVRSRHVSAGSPEESIGRWRRELSDEVAELFAEEIGEEMRAVGLEVD